MNDKNDVRIDVVGDADGFSSATREAQRELDQLKAATTRSADGMRVAAVAGELLTAAAKTGAIAVAAWTAAQLAATFAIKDTADQVGKLAQRMGESVATVSELRYAFSLANVSAEEMAGLMKSLDNRAQDAARGVGSAAAAYQAMGISARNNNGELKSNRELLGEVADKIASYKDGAAKAALVQDALGAGWVRLIPMLNVGAQGFAEAAKEAHQLGVVFDEQLVKQSADLNDNLTRLSAAAEGARIALGSRLLPTVVRLSEEFVQGIKNSDGFFDALMRYGTVNPFVDQEARLKSLKAEFEQVDFRLSNDRAKAGDAETSRRLQQEITYYSTLIGKKNEAATTTDKEAKSEAPLLAVKEKKVAKMREEVSAYARLIAAIEEKISVAAAAGEADDKLTEGQRLALKTMTELRDGVLKLSEAEKVALATRLEALLVIEQENAARKDQAKWAAEWAAAQAKETQGLTSQIEKAREYLETIGLSKPAQEELAASKLEVAAAAREEYAANLENAAAYAGPLSDAYAKATTAAREQAAALGELAGLKRQTAAKEVAVEQAEASAKAWEKFADDIERSLTDSLYRAFESGDSFGDAFAKSLENTFKAMVLKFAVQMVVGTGGNVVASVADSVFGTSFSKSGGGGSSLLSSASNLSTAYSWGSTAADLAFGSSSGSLIPWLTGASAVAPSSVIAANAVGAAGGDAIGALIAAEGWSSATAAGASAAAVGAEAGAAAAAAGAEGAAAGSSLASIASAVPYIGAAVAALAYIATNSKKIFGGQQTQDVQIIGGEYSNSGFAGTTSTNYQKSGGWFGSRKEWTDTSFVDGALDQMLDTIYENVKGGFVKLGEDLGATSVNDLMAGFKAGIALQSDDPYAIAATATEQLTKAMVGYLVPAVNDVMARMGTTDLSVGLGAMLQEVKAVEGVFDLIGQSTVETFDGRTLTAITGIADQLVRLFGGIDQMNSAVGSYYQNFYDDAERLAQTKTAVNDRLTEIGAPLVETKDQFRALVDSLDLTSTSGAYMFKALMDLAPAFASVADAAEQAAAAAAEQAAETARQATEQAAATAALRRDWQNRLDVLTGATTENDLSLQSDLASTTDATTQALIRQVYAQQDLNASAEAAAQVAAQIAQQRYGLESQLLQEQGDTAALRARDLAALDESNRALQEQIWALQDAKVAAEEAARAEAERQAEIERAAQEAAQAAQAAAAAMAAIANEAAGLQNRIWQLEGNTIAIREAELAALNPANRALQEYIYTLEDAAAAAQEAARIESERQGLQKQLWQLQGNTAALRAAELAGLDASNRALQMQIWALEDSKKAADDWAQTWGKLTDDLLAQARKIRGDLAGGQSPAYLQAQFAIDSAAARAGDATAAGRLVGLSNSLLTSYAGTAGSAVEYKRMQAYLASSLEDTAGAFTPAASGDNAAAREVASLREENRTQAATLARLLSSMDKLYSRWDRDGLPATRAEV